MTNRTAYRKSISVQKVLESITPNIIKFFFELNRTDQLKEKRQNVNDNPQLLLVVASYATRAAVRIINAIIWSPSRCH